MIELHIAEELRLHNTAVYLPPRLPVVDSKNASILVMSQHYREINSNIIVILAL